MDEKNNFSVRLNAGLLEAINNFKEMYEENSDSLKTDKAILEALLDTALAKYQPYKDNSQKINELQAQVTQLEALKVQLMQKNSENENIINDVNNQLKNFKNANNYATELESDIFIRKSQLTAVHRQLLVKYLTDKKTFERFKELNKNGKYNNFFDIPNKEEPDKFLLSVFLASAIGKVLPEVVPNSKIYSAIEKVIQTDLL